MEGSACNLAASGSGDNAIRKKSRSRCNLIPFADCIDKFLEVLHIRCKVDIIITDNPAPSLKDGPVQCPAAPQTSITVDKVDTSIMFAVSPHEICTSIGTSVFCNNDLKFGSNSRE